MNAAKNLQTLEDFLNLKDPEHAELIDGQIVHKAMAGGEHAGIAAAVLGVVWTKYNRPKRKGGGGGWWIQTEVSVHYPKMERVLQADIAGWRRESYPEKPKGYPVKLMPNWVCEICHTTEKKDTTTVPQTLAAHGIEFYWLLYVESENLQIFRLENGSFMLAGSYFKDDGLRRIPPFEDLEIDVGVLLGNDPEE